MPRNSPEYDRKYRAAHPRVHARNRDLKRFGGLRESVIQRDGERCVDCGMTRDEHKERYGRDISVNHINGNGRYSEQHESTLNNMETLCLPCHTRKDNYRRNADPEANSRLSKAQSALQKKQLQDLKAKLPEKRLDVAAGKHQRVVTGQQRENRGYNFSLDQFTAILDKEIERYEP